MSSFHYLQVLPPYSSSYSEANCLADVFVWTGELTITGYPSFQDCHSFSDASSHFELERISSAEYDIKFVNQVRGKQSHVNERTRNDVDGGLQSLPTGPCTVPQGWTVPLCNGDKSLSSILQSTRPSPESIGHPNTYVPNNRKRGLRPAAARKRADAIEKAGNAASEWKHLSDVWRRRRIIVDSDVVERSVAITDSSDSLASTAKDINAKWKALSAVPLIDSSPGPWVTFVGVSKQSYRQLKKDHNGSTNIDDYNVSVQEHGLVSQPLLDMTRSFDQTT